MLRPRSVLVVAIVALLAWLATAYFVSGFDMAATQARLGTQLTELGLPGLGSLLLGRASNAYLARLSAVSTDKAAASQARAQFARCEFACAEVLRERGNATRAKAYYDRIASTCPETATRAKAWAAYMGACDGQASARRTLLGLVYDEPQDPAPTYLAGRLFLEEGKVDEALRYLGKSLATSGGETHAASLAMAQASWQAGRREPALTHARQALRLGVTESEKLRAARLLRDLDAHSPSPVGLWGRTFASRHWSGLTGLVVLFGALLYPLWLSLLARVAPSAAALPYLWSGASEPSAIRAYEAALRRWPSSPRVLRALANAYRRVGVGTSRAAELWERLHELRPADAEARDQVVRLALEGGRETDAALHACLQWFSANPSHPDGGVVATHLARGYRVRRTTPPDTALPALEVAARGAPADRDLRLYLGSLYSHYARHAEALAVFKDLVEGNPFDEATRLEYAHALIAAGNAYDAYRHLRLLAPNAEVTTDLYLAGLVAQSAGRYRESLRILQEVLRRDPGLFDVEDRVAEASVRATHNRLGRLQLAGGIAAHEAYLLHRATHPEYGEVLLLVFRRDFSDALDFPAAFSLRLGELRRPLKGCAEILDLGSDEEEYYVTYRMPPGRPLSAWLEERGSLSPPEAAELMGPVLESLGNLHSTGHVHGDLRPSAVWLDNDRQATLVGAAASLVAEPRAVTTPPGARSPFYVAPEVVERHELSPASDLYAAGCLLYELLVGSPPLEGPTHLATMMAHVTIVPEPPSMGVPGIPPEVDDVVLHALAKNPADRPASATEFARELRESVTGPEETEVAAPQAEEAQYLLPFGDTGPAEAEPSEPPDPARWWTFYRGLALIATGRFARVYRGVHRQTGESHAIKQLQVPRMAGALDGFRGTRAAQAVWRLFKNEMHLLQSLSEADPPVSGIATMLQTYRADENDPAYAMPLMAETLGARLAREGPLPEAEAVRQFTALASVVSALHEQGLVHRGLSPRSVLFAPDGSLHLSGFDSACRLSDRGPLLLAEHEIQQATHSPLYVLGDIRFLSPERCRGEEFDHRTDIYSLGALLFYMLAGTAPFERTDEMQIMLDHVSTPPPLLRNQGINVTGDTQEVISHALAKSPTARHDSVAAMITALRSATPI